MAYLMTMNKGTKNMATYKIALTVTDQRYPIDVIAFGNSKDEALENALAVHPTGKLAWGTEPVKVHPINYQPIK